MGDSGERPPSLGAGGLGTLGHEVSVRVFLVLVILVVSGRAHGSAQHTADESHSKA